MPAQTAAYEALLSGYVAYIGADKATAGSYFEKIDTTQLSETALELYNTVWTEIAEEYYATLYTDGYNSYNAEKYTELKQKGFRLEF